MLDIDEILTEYTVEKEEHLGFVSLLVLVKKVSRTVGVRPGEEVGLRGVGGGGLDGLGGRRGLGPPDDTEGDPVLLTDLRPLGEDLCSTPSTAGELSRLLL